MDDLPLVSIVTPSYNQGAFLEAAICSVLEQDYPRIEYMIIDGGSSDASVSIIQKYASHLSYWVSEPDRGQAHAINKGLNRSRGEILGWLNSDDVLLAHTVSRAVAVFQQEPQIDVVYGRLERINALGELIPTPSLPKDAVEYSLADLLGECVVNQPGSFWRQSVMKRAGLLDETLQYALDYEYWARLAMLGARFLRLPHIMARFRLSAESKTVAHTTSQAEEQLRVLESLAARPDLQQILGLSQEEINRRLKRTRAVFYLQAFYGEMKQSRRLRAMEWLWAALRSNPTVIFQRRWLALVLARCARPPA